MTLPTPARATQGMPPSISATPSASLPPASAPVAPSVQSSMRSQAPASQQKDFFTKAIEWMIWLITGCGMFSKNPTAVPPPNATPRTQTPVALNPQQPATPPIATVPVAVAPRAPVLSPILQGIVDVERQMTALTQDTPENRHIAIELRWQIQTIKAQIRPGSLNYAALTARIEEFDRQLVPITGLAGMPPLDMTYVETQVNAFEAYLPDMENRLGSVDPNSHEARRARERTTEHRNGVIFVFHYALNPQDPLHLPIREKISRINQRLDAMSGQTARINIVDFGYAKECLEELETRKAQRLAAISDVEERCYESNKIRKEFNLINRVVHPQDPRHRELREIAQRVTQLLDAAEAPVPILERATRDVADAETIIADCTQNDRDRHIVSEMRWRLLKTKALLNPSEATHAPQLARIVALDGQLKDFIELVVLPPVNTALIQAKLNELAATINNLMSSHPEPRACETRAREIGSGELFLFCEALDPLDPNHLPLRDQVVRLYRKLGEHGENLPFSSFGSIDRDFADTMMQGLEARAQGLGNVNPHDVRIRNRDETGDLLNILVRSIPPRGTYFLRAHADRIRQLLLAVN